MIVTTGNDVPKHEISEVIGIVRGIVVRSPGIKQGFLGSLKQFIGGYDNDGNYVATRTVGDL